ncbi:MAG: Unknown protein [uncultured Sulfurovum sp.]|uniref:DUF4136 domain-containing protein n=1 Tax=uncultured Sulfurovum sp. TaxID=269237 RepID=A0A6S6U7N3_9BACT|nr:MAG: Unknown protein [uncultured Sulfurovum sp.]
MKRILLLILLSISMLIFTTGCSITPKYKVTIDAITANNVAFAPSTYDIKALDQNKNSSGLIFQENIGKLARVLQQKGYIRNHTGQTAKQTIYFDYGLEKVNEETQTYAEPNISFHMGYGHGYRYGGYYSPFFYPYYGTGFGGAYSTYRKTYVYYNRYVTLLAKNELNQELWRVDVSSVGESKNLRKIIPILIEATEPYLGSNTPEPVQIIIRDGVQKR